MNEQTDTPPKPRTSKALADAMWDELDDLTNGRSTPQHARAKAALANVICGVARLEMDYARFVSDARGGRAELLREGNSLPALTMGGTVVEAEASRA